MPRPSPKLPAPPGPGLLPAAPAPWRPAAALLLLAASCGGASSPARDAILITLDTTRADAVAGFGGDPAVTPRLAELLEESTLFVEARTTCPVTLPAHASMLTGLVPPRHGLRDNGLVALPEEAVTVAEACAAAGLRTAAFVSASVLDPVFGLDQGFEVYDPPTRPGFAGGPIAERSAAETVARATAWLEGVGRDERFFLWVHLYDAHLPYEPAPEFLAQAGGRPYLGEVAANDAALGTLLDALRRAGRFEDALLVIVADHGEGLGDHGERGHGALCYASTVRIPLLVRRPGGEGGRSQALVSAADVHPTLLRGLGLDVPPDLDGVGLFDSGAARDGVYFESLVGYLNYGWSPLAGWAWSDLVYLHSSRPELYRLSADPEERVDLSLGEEGLCAEARGRIAERLARPALDTEPFDPAPELLDTLRSLGYAGNDAGVDRLPSVLAPSDRPSPRDRVGELTLLLTGDQLLSAGRYEESARTLEQLVAANPNHYMGLDLLGFARMNLGEFGRAAQRYEEMLSCGPERADALLNLGTCYEQTGRPDRARAVYARLLELEPDSAEARDALARLSE